MADLLPETPLVQAAAAFAAPQGLMAPLPSPIPPLAPVTPAPSGKTLTNLDAGLGGWGKTVYVLVKPFVLHGTPYTSVTIREPSGGDVMRHQKDGRFELRALLVDLTELPDDVFSAMHAKDYNGVMNAVGELLAPSLPTSTT